MKATLTFNLPDDREGYMNCVKANDMAMALFDITHNLKKTYEYKYESAEAQDVIEDIFKGIWDIINEHNLQL